MKVIISLSLILCMCISAWGAAFEDIGSVRARGMGEAFESISAGIESIRYNPAGSAYMKSFQFYGGYGMPAGGYDDETKLMSIDFGLGIPFFKSVSMFPKVIRDGSFSFLYHQFNVTDFAYERVMTINISKSLNNFFEGANLALGVNLNLFGRGFTHDDDTLLHPDLNLNDSASGVGLDLGLTYDFSRFIRLSFVFANILEPNISFFSDGKEYVNQQIKGGIAYNFQDVLFFQDLMISAGLVQISRDTDDNRRPETIYKIGAEFWQFNRYTGFRVGYKTSVDVLTSGFTAKIPVSKKHFISASYAFNYPVTSRNYKHYFSLNYEFEFADHAFDFRTDGEIKSRNARIKENFSKGMVVLKYKTKDNDNLYNISSIHYDSPEYIDLLKQHNEIKDEKSLPVEMEIPYDAKGFKLYTVNTGDTLESISQIHYGTPDKIGKIKRYNKLEFTKLRTGRVLIIPVSKVVKRRKKKADKKVKKNEPETPKTGKGK